MSVKVRLKDLQRGGHLGNVGEGEMIILKQMLRK